MRVDLAGRPVAVTGASSGIGAATAVACAQAGMPVGLFARRAEKLEEVRGRIVAAGGRAVCVPGSVDDDADCLRLLAETERAFGPLYAVVANAGYGIEAPAWSMPEDDLRAIFETNFYGSLRVVRPALAGMVERGAGHAVFISSGLSKIGVPRFAAYSATKAAQDHFARAMRIELGGRGVAVSSVHPVVTETEFSRSADERGREARRFTNRQPRGLTQTPERVAAAVVRRLRTGRGAEVWTSLPARLSLGAASAFPGLADAALARMYRRRMGAG
jgi:short-subunit dehydrogenase